MITWLNALDWNTIITSLGISGLAIWGGIRFVLAKGADFHFSKQLEKYKRDLQDISEKTKFEYQQKLSDFNLYTAKKHEHYINLYEKILNANGYVSYLASPLKSRPSYTWFNVEDLREHLQKLLLPNGRVDELINFWNENKTEAEKEIYKCITLKEELDAEISISEMKNFFWKSQLYMTEALSSKIQSHMNHLNDLYYSCKSEYAEYMEPKERAAHRKSNIQSKEAVDRQFQNIVDLMKEELAIGYYSEKKDA